MKVSARKRSPTLGFTLIELLIVIAIIGVLSAISIPSFSNFNNNQRLSQAAKQVKNDLRSAQNRALSGIEGSAWGINVNAGEAFYTLFKCPTTAAYTLTTCSLVTTKSLPSGFTIQAPDFTDLVFEVASGELYVDGVLVTAGNFSFDVDLDGSTRTITVSAGGKIEER